MSFLGSREFGGRGVLPYGVDMALVTVLALAFYFWGVRSGDPEAMEEVPQDGD